MTTLPLDDEQRKQLGLWWSRWVAEDVTRVWRWLRRLYAYDRRLVFVLVGTLAAFGVMAGVNTHPVMFASPFLVAYFAPMPVRQHHRLRFRRACRIVHATKVQVEQTWLEAEGPGAGRRMVPWTRLEETPHLTRMKRSPIGWVGDVVAAPGMTIPTLIKHREDLASALALRDVHVEANDDNARLGHIILTERDPFPKGQRVRWEGMTLQRTTIWNPVRFGIDRFGEPIEFTMPYRNILLGGIPDAGKSVAERVVLSHVALDPEVPLYLFDGGDVDMYPFKQCVEASVEGAYVGPDPAEAIPVLQHLVDEMGKRMRLVRGNSYDEWRDKIVRGQEPPIYIVIGEWASYLDRCTTGAQKNEFNRLTRLLIANGRKLLIITSASTQKPSFDIIPTNIRDLFAYRMALRCTTSSMSDMILGDWSEAGFDAARILPHQAGVGLLHVDGAKPRLVRAAYPDQDDVRAIAQAGANLRAAYVAEQMAEKAGTNGSKSPRTSGVFSEGLTASGRNVSLHGVSSAVKGSWTVDGDGGVSGSDDVDGADAAAAEGVADAGSGGAPPPVDVDAPPVDDGKRVTSRLRRGRRPSSG